MSADNTVWNNTKSTNTFRILNVSEWWPSVVLPKLSETRGGEGKENVK